MSDQLFIVAEISKNWEQTWDAPVPPELLSQEFERVIAVNLDRGYKLHSFQLHRVMTSPTVLNETIIAVFELAFVRVGREPGGVA